MEEHIRAWLLEKMASVLDIPLSYIKLDRKFTQLGGNSLSAVHLTEVCKHGGVSLPVAFILGSDDIAALLDWAVADASKQQHEEAKLPESSNGLVDPTLCVKRMPHVYQFEKWIPVTAQDASQKQLEGTPMTEMQLALIHGTQKHPSHNIISYAETYLSIHIPVIRAAWQEIINMEPIFHTKFDLRNGGRLIEDKEAIFLWNEKTVPDQAAYEAELHQNPSFFQRATDDSCDLMIGTCFDAVTSQNEVSGSMITTIIWRIHHALIDGYSAMLIIQKVRRIAAGLPVERSPSFSTLAENLRRLQVTSTSAGKEFWQKQYAAYPSAAGELLLASPNNSLGMTEVLSFQMPLTELTGLAQSTGVTLATLCYAAWALTLTLYTDSDVVLFGAVLSGRNLPLPDVERTVGPLVNTLPLHVAIDRSLSIPSFLRQCFGRLVELACFQWTLPEHGYKRQFSSALSMQFDMIEAGEGPISPIAKPYSTSQTDIPLSIFIDTDGTVRLQYDTAIFHGHDVQTLRNHYQDAFSVMLESHCSMGRCLDSLVNCETRRKLRVLGNCISTQTTFASVQDDLISLFDRTVSLNPDCIAIEKGCVQITYRQLDAATTQIAHHLERFILRGDIICLHADRSVNWIYGIYGILKAGGVYCPIDPSLPQTLRDSNFESAGAKAFLIPYRSDSPFRPASCTVVLAVEEILDESLPGRATLPMQEYIADPLTGAYICFTSGSTGKQKGVMCTHAGLVAFQRDSAVRLMARPGWKIAQTMSVAFDGSIHEIFSALSYGATLVLPHSVNPFAHLTRVDAAILTPSAAKVLDPTHFAALSTVYLVGEPVSQEVNDRWGAQKTLYNMYGPTEGTGGATIKRLLPGQPVSIGQPNPSTRIYILNSKLSLIPPGVCGEICLAGVQVARGYINLPKETVERFLPDPICGGLGEMVYRTGDRGYWNVITGEIICLGRKDRQIKLRGFRLDLNDLEVRMVRANSTVTAAAIAQKDDHLVAMITPSTIDTVAFSSQLGKILPGHALPKYIVAVDKFPMTGANKLDYKAVANYMPVSDGLSASKKPLTCTENKLAGVWRVVLRLDLETAIDRDSNFIDLGGHSVLQLHLVTRLSDEFGCQIPFSVVIESTTLQHMAETIDMISQHNSSVANKAIRCCEIDEHELSPIELEWWNKYQLDEGSSAFNVCFAADFDPIRVDRLQLAAAWNTVLTRHRILRCRYVRSRHGGVRRRYAGCPPQVQRMSQLDVWKEVNRPFNLMRNDPIRVMMSKDTLLVVISHIVCDLTTLDLLNQQVATLYRGTGLSAVDKSYMDTMFWNNIAAPCDLDFWTRYMENTPGPETGFEVRVDRVSYRGSSMIVNIPRAIVHGMLEVVTMERMTFHQFALAAVALTMHADRKQLDIVLGGPHLNRKTMEALDSVGLFLEPLPIRINSTPTSLQTSEEFLQLVRTASQEALVHAVPWNQLLHHLGVQPDFPNHPLFDIMVTFHDNRRKPAFSLPGVEPVNHVWAEGSKFKLMFEFSAVSNGQLILRIEHDRDCYPTSVVEKIQRLLLTSLRLLAERVPYGELRQRLAIDYCQ